MTRSALLRGGVVPGLVRPVSVVVPAVSPFFRDSFASGVQTSYGGFLWEAASGRRSVSAARAWNDEYSMRFRYGPDAEGADSSVEMRFDTGRESSELWIQYYLYVPDNFILRSQSPGKNKFFSIWANSYSVDGDTQIIFEYDQNGANN